MVRSRSCRRSASACRTRYRLRRRSAPARVGCSSRSRMAAIAHAVACGSARGVVARRHRRLCVHGTRARAIVVLESLRGADNVAGVAIDVERIDDHGRAEFEILDGVRWRSLDEAAERRDVQVRADLRALAFGPNRQGSQAGRRASRSWRMQFCVRARRKETARGARGFSGPCRHRSLAGSGAGTRERAARTSRAATGAGRRSGRGRLGLRARGLRRGDGELAVESSVTSPAQASARPPHADAFVGVAGAERKPTAASLLLSGWEINAGPPWEHAAPHTLALCAG